MTQNKLIRNNIILLICLLITVLLYPLLFVHLGPISKIIFTGIILSGTFSLEFKKRTRNILITFGTVTIFLIWLNYFIINDWLKITMYFSFFCFNLFITVFMVRHIARSQNVTLTILINSINCYLIIGVLGALLLAMEEILRKIGFHLDAGGINFAGSGAQGFHDYLYFSFVTMTTLGYGDVTPVSSFAKSTTIIIAVAGQLYLTMLVAMLVGKFLSRTQLD
jgi:voltage-gated potassium channel